MEEKRMQNTGKLPAVRGESERSAVAAKASGKAVVKKAERLPANASSMHAVRAPRVINVKKQDKKPFPWAVVFVAIILTTLFLFMMMNYAEVDKYRSEIADLDSKMATMQKVQDTLEVQLTNKYNLSDIKDYAENELGMVTKDKLTHHRITIDQEDKIEMHSYDDGEEGGMGFLLTGFGEVIRDFFSKGE
ncbi:MAG: hypothetical protein J5925_00300 [Clostridia bacterium]|nr:hypothetical protein [Clostridia bacterium]